VIDETWSKERASILQKATLVVGISALITDDGTGGFGFGIAEYSLGDILKMSAHYLPKHLVGWVAVRRKEGNETRLHVTGPFVEPKDC